MTQLPHGLVDILELSPSQQGMLLQVLAHPQRHWHEEVVICDLQGVLDAELLRQAWGAVVERHESLRTTFHVEGLSKPVQVVHQTAALSWQVEDWRDLASSDVDARTRALACDPGRWELSLSDGPLTRLALARLGEHRHRLFWKHHHLILDGWSVAIVLADVWAAYRVLSSGRPLTWPAAPPMRDYIAWLQRQAIAPSQRFWRTAFDDAGGAIRRATAEPLPPTPAAYAVVDIEWPLDRAAVLERLAEEWRVTAGAIVNAAWAWLLMHRTPTPTVTYGATYSGRAIDCGGAPAVVGLLMNTLPIRLARLPDERFAGLVARLHGALAQTATHQWNSLGQVHEWSDTVPGAQLFDSVLVVENYPGRQHVGQVSEQLQVTRVASLGARTAFPLVVLLTLAPRLGCRFVFDETWNAGEASALVSAFVALLQAVLGRRDPANVTIPAASPPEYDEAAAVADESHDESPIEREIARLWCDVLGVARVGLHERFFDLGGHSLAAVRLLDRIRLEFAVELPLAILFGKAATVAALAVAVEDALLAATPDEVLQEELQRIAQGHHGS